MTHHEPLDVERLAWAIIAATNGNAPSFYRTERDIAVDIVQAYLASAPGHAYEAHATSGQCIHCGQIGSYAHTAEGDR